MFRERECMADAIKVLIEIPEGSSVKYELDEETGELMVDRLVPVAMGYPVNYGLIAETSGEDGDALDALVFLSAQVVPGVMVKCKVIGMLEMEDEEGIDHKIICVPAKTKIDPLCGAWESLADIPEAKKRQIRHFFEHYKDLEEGKWVKLNDWQNAEQAAKVLQAGQERFAQETAEECECCGNGECDCPDGQCACGKHHDCDGKDGHCSGKHHGSCDHK